MRTTWRDDGVDKAVTAPLSLIVSAFARVADARRALTPQLRTRSRRHRAAAGRSRPRPQPPRRLGAGAGLRPARRRRAGSRRSGSARRRSSRRCRRCIAQAGSSPITTAPTAACSRRCAKWRSRRAAALDVDARRAAGRRRSPALFNEELGAVLAGRAPPIVASVARCIRGGGPALRASIGAPARDGRARIRDPRDGRNAARRVARRPASRLVGDDACAAAAARQSGGARIRNTTACSTRAIRASSPALDVRPERRHRRAVHRARGARPTVADPARAGRQRPGRDGRGVRPRRLRRVRRAHERHHRRPRASLADFTGFVACGGFSYGDVLGAGEGWAKSILFNAARARRVRRVLRAQRHVRARRVQRLPDDEQPARADPRHRRTGRTSCAIASEQFEARLVLVEVQRSPSLFFAGMEGSRIPVATRARRGLRGVSRCGAARAGGTAGRACASSTIAARPTERYPYNPNGSPRGITGLTTADGRFTILMPHPERVFRTVQMSWHPDDWGEDSPWMRMFRNARAWLG